MNILKYLSSWKYRYFVKKVRGVECMIADLVFKRFKTLYVREQIRKEYDQLRSKLEILKTQIAADKDKGGNVDEIKRMEDQEVLLNKDIEKKVAQMKQLDIEVQGSKPSEELPEGHQGLNDTLEALRELMVITKGYLKEL